MQRRVFVQFAVASLAADLSAGWVRRGECASAKSMDVVAFRAARRFIELEHGRIAYVERGTGQAALFLHGLPLNGFQWRGAIERLCVHRRCIAPDFMGLGYSEISESQSVAPKDQVAMLAALLDKLALRKVDIVANDSGGGVAQLFLARHPERVRTLLLTNCDVEPDSPPVKLKPVIEMARAGTLAGAIEKLVHDKARARAAFANTYRDPGNFTDEAIEYYFTPLLSSPLRRAQYHAYQAALDPNPLAGIEARLKHSSTPVRMVWGMRDEFFPPADAEYLDCIFPQSRGIRRVAEGKLFFPEEYPDILAEEAQRLWSVKA